MNPIYEPCYYSVDELKRMKARLLLKGISAWNHTQYSLVCQILKILNQPTDQKSGE